jgi:biotin carboxyl carrier protein
MKRDLTLTLDSVEYSVLVDGNAITVNDRGFAVEVVNDSTVLVDGIVYHVTLGESQATVDGQTFALQLDEGATGTATSPSAPRNVPAAVQESRPGAIPAVMPGKVLRLLVEPGQYVEEGDPICILEAMKMENELHASRSGIVRAVHVQSGDDVEKGQVLLEIEQTE